MLRLVAHRSLAFLGSGGLLLVGLLLIAGCRGASPLVDLDHTRALAADLRLQFNQADKAVSQAVMADTDEASIAFARAAEQAIAGVAHDLTELRPLLEKLGYSRELATVATFQDRWSKYQKLDREILALAVENTNLKAQRLSFGPAREAADAFRDAVVALAAGVGGADRCGASERAQKAIVSIREIQVLLAPHIAEADDVAMTRLEQDMTVLEQKARAALEQLSDQAGAGAAPRVTSATASLDRFKEVSAQIVKLSRQNTNVRSLALSLREQPALAAACDESLRALQQALESEGSKATR